MAGKPTYDLQQLQVLVGQGALTRSITVAATDGAAMEGLHTEDIVDAVLLLTPRNFYKTMESESIPELWQDVYRLEYRGVLFYIKLQIGRDGRAFVVQFKQK